MQLHICACITLSSENLLYPYLHELIPTASSHLHPGHVLKLLMTGNLLEILKRIKLFFDFNQFPNTEKIMHLLQFDV